tara:strand:+ start:1156 stop:1383 length:228 start_codon:yes stop_codon:yes gene_type:complete
MTNLLVATGTGFGAYGAALLLAGAVGLWTPCPASYNSCSELQSKATSTLLIGGALLGTGAGLFVIGAERERRELG